MEIKEILFAIARFGIHYQWEECTPPEIPQVLLQTGASFVTLTINDELRGSSGTVVPYESFAIDIERNAYAAAFSDHRFTPLIHEEFDDIRIEVTLLSAPQLTPYRSLNELRQIIRPGIDGVLFEAEGHRASFLPQVWNHLRDFDLFFKYLAKQAGIVDDPFAHSPKISLFQAELFKEPDRVESLFPHF